MVQVVRGMLLEADVPTKVLVVWFNEQCAPSEKFVICELDETRLMIKPSGLKYVQDKLRDYHNKNTFIAPAKDGQGV